MKTPVDEVLGGPNMISALPFFGKDPDMFSYVFLIFAFLPRRPRAHPNVFSPNPGTYQHSMNVTSRDLWTTNVGVMVREDPPVD